jgi:NADH:ubiquinone oxidoreductase subunit 6 (subunit J)
MYNILLPACIISLSFAVVFFKNPIYSLLALIAVFFSMVIFLLSIKVEFLGMIFLIIYIGAISILFLFVIMMFNLKDIKAVKKSINFYISASLFNFVVIPKFYFVVCTHIQKHFLYNQIFINNISDLFNDPVNSVKYMQDILIISTSLYTKDAPVFIMLGYVLLAAMVGAIILALSSTSRLEKN